MVAARWKHKLEALLFSIFALPFSNWKTAAKNGKWKREMEKGTMAPIGHRTAQPNGWVL